MTNRRVFQLLDLDRTLFDTVRFVKFITDEIDKTNKGLGKKLNEQFEAAYASGETFFVMRYLREHFGDQAFETLVERTVEREGSDSLLLPGARERIVLADELSSLRPSWGILTFGDAADQLLKIRIVGFERAPLFIAETPDKGPLIASWHTSDGTFALPESLGGHIADELIFEDDKLRAFNDLPENVLGMWITQVDDAHEKMNEADLSVVPVRHLAESVEYLKNKFMTES